MYKISELTEQYQKKLVSAADAVSIIKSGDRIHYGLFGGMVRDLDDALAERTDELEDVFVYGTIWGNPEPPSILKRDPEARHFKYLNTHFSPMDRQMNKQGCCWFIPVMFRNNDKMFAENLAKNIDVAMLQVCPMDKNGFFNLGPQVGEYWSVFKNAKKIIVEVNENMPVCHGIKNQINLAEVDYIVHGTNRKLGEVTMRPATDIEKKIAGYIAPMIESGSSLQLGIGGIPNTIGAVLCESDVGDLSVHTEMFVDAYIGLFRAGKITGNKNHYPGKMVCTFSSGTRDLHEFIHENQLLCFAPADFVNNIAVISALDKMISINGCLQVDIFGQVNSESSGFQHIGGTGGQMDYVIGAFQSNGGKSFLCTPSTRVNKDGSLTSLIRPRLEEGAIVSIPRAMVHYVVTEYGAVNLMGKSTFERAELVASIAHPQFRDELMHEAERMGLTSRTSRIQP